MSQKLPADNFEWEENVSKFGLKNCEDTTALIQYWTNEQDVNKSNNEYNPRNNIKVLNVFDEMISSKKRR